MAGRRGGSVLFACVLAGASITFNVVPVGQVHAATALVSGTVTSGGSGLVGATVSLVPQLNPSGARSTTTGFGGAWSVVVEEGDYSLTVSKLGHQPTSGEHLPVTASGMSGLVHDLPELAPVTFTGQLTDGTTGIGGSIVPSYIGPNALPVFLPSEPTDPDGSFTLVLPAYGQWQLTASAAGFTTRRLIDPLTPPPIPGSTVALGAQTLLPGARIHGRVTNSLGQGIAGVNVSLSAPLIGGAFTTTGGDGTYSLTVAPGSYLGLQFSVAGYEGACVPCTSASYAAGSVTVVNAVLVRSGSVSGRVTDPNGLGVDSASVTLIPAGAPPGPPPAGSLQRTTSGGGFYSFPSVRPGIYLLVVNVPPPLLQEYYGGSAIAAGAAPIVVGESEVVTGIDVQLDVGSTGTITLRTAAGGVPAAATSPGAAMCAAPAIPSGPFTCSPSGAWVTNAFPAPTGVISIATLRSGAYVVRGFASGAFVTDPLPLTVVGGIPFACTVIVDGPGSTCGAPPEDDDGVPSAEEDGHPNGGDGNGDGTPDSQQDHVTSLVAPSGDYVTVESEAGTGLAAVSIDDAPAGPYPPGVTPLEPGLISYTVTGVDPGATIDITLHLAGPTTANTYAKFHGGAWIELDPSQFDIDGLNGVITLHLTDGEIGDDDGIADGTIVDPGLPALFEPFDIEWLLPSDTGVLLATKAKQTTGFGMRVLDAAGEPVGTPGTVGVPTSIATPCPARNTKAVDLPSTTRHDPATVHLGGGVWVAGWSPAKEWRGTCRLVTVPFADGTLQTLTIKIT
jgi:hypothetical protein